MPPVLSSPNPNPPSYHAQPTTDASGKPSKTASLSPLISRPPIQLDSVPNIRDFAEALSYVQPGRVLRCAKPTEASHSDVEFLVGTLGIRELIDLRSGEELAEDPPNSELLRRSTLVTHSRSWATGKIYRFPMGRVLTPVTHHNVSLLMRRRYYIALLQHVPVQALAKAARLRLFSKEASRLVILREVNAGGLLLFYKILVDSAQPEIVTALRLITEALRGQQPVLLFCKAGKDRTGIVSALVLLVSGATPEQVIADYARSDAFHMVALAGIENKPELAGLDRAAFERAPAEAMKQLLAYIDQQYGSWQGYLERSGFSAGEQEMLRRLMTEGKSL